MSQVVGATAAISEAAGSPGFVFLNPLSLATDDCRSVLAVKGSLRRFAPWTRLRADPRRKATLRGAPDELFALHARQDAMLNSRKRVAAGRSGRRGCLRGKGDVPASAGPDQRVRTSNPRLEFPRRDCRHGFDVRVTPRDN